MSTETPPAGDAWTVRKVLDWTIGYLKQHGSASPRLDAEVLLAHARGCARIQLYTQYDEILTDAVRQTMRDLVKRRAAAEPVAYLVGHKEFYSLSFEVNREVLIPRPETELLVMETLQLIAGKPQPRILELGVGSGCVSISIATHAKTASIVGVEIHPATLVVAQRNVDKHKVRGRVDLRCGDLFAPIKAEERYDWIVSNPPYVATGEIAGLSPDVQKHEPHRALDGGPDGLEIIRRIADGATRHLSPGGGLLIEFSPEQSGAITDLFRSHPSGYQSVTTIPDLSGQPRVLRAYRAG